MAPTLIDLFSGCGGVTQGFKNVGFDILAAVERDHITAQTYSANHPDVGMYEDDIRNIDPTTISRDCDLQKEGLSVLSVCAPCQPFSRQNRRDSVDNRTELILEALRFVEILRPRFILMENVPGLGKGKNSLILDKFVHSLRNDQGYSVLNPVVVDAVSYGVPQFRKRLILICTCVDIDATLPEFTHVSPNKPQQDKENWRTVRDAFVGIHRLSAGSKSRTDNMHRARNHTAVTLERLRHIPQNGGSRHSLPDHLQLDCHKKGGNGYNDVYGRMNFDMPANTLTTGCTNVTRGRFAHPTANRAITLREAARLQTFPDDYQFLGNYEQISAQIGNAVPVALAEAFAREFYRLDRG